MSGILEREEYVEQAYFFRTLRERQAENLATQQILERVHEEILSITRLPHAIQFLACELKHSGLLSSGFARLPHYFTPFQTFIIRCTENEMLRFPLDTALLVLEREAEYRAGGVTPPGLFVYQFEVMCRNRLGYEEGIQAMAQDPFYDERWRAFLRDFWNQIGVLEFAELIFLRSESYVLERRRTERDYQPPLPVLFGEKEGKIARANRGRDPLYLFAALQRQLGYPVVPRPKPRDDAESKLAALKQKVVELEKRIRLVESELKGKVDLSEFGKPELLQNPDDEIEIP